MFYSKSTNGFYDVEVHGTKIPKDCVEISTATWQALMDGQGKGMVIQSDKSGYPIAVDYESIPVSDEDLIKRFNLATQDRLDTAARDWGYDSLISAASYVNSTNSQFKSEAEVLIAWRDATWDKAFTIEAGNPPKKFEDFLVLLPVVPTKPVV